MTPDPRPHGDPRSGVPAVGEPAPGFALPDQHGNQVSLTGLVRHRHALVVFFPHAFSSICTAELLEVQLNIDRFVNDAVQVVGISCDPRHSLRMWAAHEGYRFPLLSDFWPHGEVSRGYGVFHEERGMAVRGTFLVDPAGTVRWRLVREPGQQRDIGELHAAVRAVTQPTT